jgi:hypothetical protein
MKILTEQSKCKGIVNEWIRQYGKNEKRGILHKLQKLKGVGTPKEIADIIGNDSWTSLDCSECGEKVGDVIVLGEPQDYESYTAYICKKCLTKAVKMFLN